MFTPFRHLCVLRKWPKPYIKINLLLFPIWIVEHFHYKTKQLSSYEAMNVRVAITCQNIDKKIDNELRHFVGLSSHVIL